MRRYTRRGLGKLLAGALGVFGITKLNPGDTVSDLNGDGDFVVGSSVFHFGRNTGVGFKGWEGGRFLWGRTSGLTGTGDIDAAGHIASGEYIRLIESSNPFNAGAGDMALYAEDNGEGKTCIKVRFANGVCLTLVTEA